MSFVLDLQALETKTSVDGPCNNGCDDGYDDSCGGSSLSVIC